MILSYEDFKLLEANKVHSKLYINPSSTGVIDAETENIDKAHAIVRKNSHSYSKKNTDKVFQIYTYGELEVEYLFFDGKLYALRKFIDVNSYLIDYTQIRVKTTGEILKYIPSTKTFYDNKGKVYNGQISEYKTMSIVTSTIGKKRLTTYNHVVDKINSPRGDKYINITYTTNISTGHDYNSILLYFDNDSKIYGVEKNGLIKKEDMIK